MQTQATPAQKAIETEPNPSSSRKSSGSGSFTLTRRSWAKPRWRTGSPIPREPAAATRAQNAGRIGARQGKVSELTGFLPFAKGGAKRLRGLLQLLEGNFRAADAVGTVHDMRFVFLDNDTKLLFATAYDGDWDAYIEDFATKIPTLWICCSAIWRVGREFVTRR